MFSTQPLSQRDPRWSDWPLGFGDASTTIGSDGCTLTCLTMAANGFGFTETPQSLNDKLKALGQNMGFSGPLIVFSGLPSALAGISLQSVVFCRNTPAPMADIDAALDTGFPVIVELDHSTAPGLQNHWVMIVGRSQGDYLINDPWPVPAEPPVSLTGRFGFAGTPAQIITIAVFYQGPLTQAVQPLTLSVVDTQEIANFGGLALRFAPMVGRVIKRLPAGTRLSVNEAADQAMQKVGQWGEWIAVTTLDGMSGYVAAWLVQANHNPMLLSLAPHIHSLPKVADPALIGVVQPPLR